MSSLYRFGEAKEGKGGDAPGFEGTTTQMERLLEQSVGALCRAEGISRAEMLPIQRVFLTNYRCHACKLLPLYRLDLSHIKRPRCGRCGDLVSFTNAGKYGKMRKKLAVMLWRARCGLDVR